MGGKSWCEGGRITLGSVSMAVAPVVALLSGVLA